MMNDIQKEIVKELIEKGDIGPFDFAEKGPIEKSVRFGDIVIEEDGDTYYG